MQPVSNLVHLCGAYFCLLGTALLFPLQIWCTYVRQPEKSFHYTNYINAEGVLPRDRDRLLKLVDRVLFWSEDSFRPVYVGRQ